MKEVSRTISASPTDGIISSTFSSDNLAEVEAISSLLSIHGRFVLASVICNDLTLQRAVIADLQQSTPDIAVVEMSADQDNDPFAVADSETPSQPPAIFIIGLTDWLSGPNRRLTRARAFNASRERWVERFGCPVLLWMNRTTAHVLAQHAPDIWRYRSHRFEFEHDETAELFNAFVSESAVGGEVGIQLESADDARERINELRQRLHALPPDAPSSVLFDIANAWRNEIGLIQFRLGELDEAKRTWHYALEIDRQRAGTENQAIRTILIGNLGLIARIRGDLDEAQKLHHEALEINRKLGRLEGQAIQLGNLGLIARTRGDLDEAEKLHREALEIHRKIGSLDGQATQLGSLGVIARTRGDLDEAEKLHHEALEIHRKIGRLEGQAAHLANLGLIARTRGDLDEAEKLLREALEINRKLGRLEGQASELGNLGLIARTRGDLDEAEKLHREALEIHRKIGSLDGQATQLANIGLIAEQRGNIAEARRVWTESRDLYARIGMPQMVKELNGWLDDLPAVAT